MSYGYNGRILHVDLNKRSWELEKPSERWYRTYLGGGGIASYFLIRYLKEEVDPLSEDNILVFAASVITGAPISGFSRYTVAAKSPLTGAFGESEAGGYFGPELKFAGYDAIVVHGRARTPVYLWIHDGDVEIKDATALWGLDTGDTLDAIRADVGVAQARVASIGQAGEQMILFANVISDLAHAHGRTGMGAVMGSKNLKAVAVRGTHRMEFAEPDLLKEIARWHNSTIKENSRNKNLCEFGTPGDLMPLNKAGILPTRYFKSGVFDGAEKIGFPGYSKIFQRSATCYACTVACKRVVATSHPYEVNSRYGGPEYETLAAFGSNCAIDELPAIAKAHEMCNRYGMDTISAGNCIAFAMECFERGILTEADTGGRSVRFGSADDMLWLLNEIVQRRGLGRILSNGVKRAAEEIGRGAEDFAFHIKGQEIPMHEPRGKTGLALAYALSPTGADHLESAHEPSFAGPGISVLAPLGLLEPTQPLAGINEQKVRFFANMQRIWSLYNSLGVCNFVAAPAGALSFSRLVQAVSAITGWETSLEELLTAGERAQVMARIFNVRQGIGLDHARFFSRMYQPLASGPLEGQRIDPDQLQKAVNLYYDMVGWDNQGEPKPAKLAQLGLDWLIK